MKSNSKKTIITCNVSNSICSLLSSMTGFARDLILDFFPENYFKDIYISTALASSQQAEIDDDDIPIKQYPQLSITPSFVPDYDDTYGGPYPTWRRGIVHTFNHYSSRYGYKKIFYNDEDNLIISAIPNRVKFSFDYKVKVETHLQKMDVVYMLRQKFHNNDRVYWNNQLLKAQIPNTLIQALSSCKDLEIKDPYEREEFFRYLKNHSQGHIEPVIYTGSGNHTFVHTYLANILVTVETPPDTDTKTVTKNNMAGSEEIVEMTLTMELWIPSNYMFECNSLPSGRYEPTFDESKVYIYGSVPLRPNNTIGDKTLIKWQELVTEVNTPLDSISMDDFLPIETLDFINEQLQKRDYEYLVETFMFVLYRDRKKLDFGKDFVIDWREKKIVLLNPFFNYNYHIGCYANQATLYEWRELKRIEESKK